MPQNPIHERTVGPIAGGDEHSGEIVEWHWSADQLVPRVLLAGLVEECDGLTELVRFGHYVELMVLIGFAVVLTVLAVARFRLEPRRLSNGLFMVAVLTVWGLAALSLINRLEIRVEAVVLVVVGVSIFLGLIVSVAALAFNGAVVARREGVRPATALPLAAATAVTLGCGLLAMTFMVLEQRPLPLWFLAVLWAGVLYALAIGIQLIAFTLHALIYGRMVPAPGAATVIVLGCGLGPGGTVTPLLAGRLDRAVGVFGAEVEAGHTPWFVVSGGQGNDEAKPEAVAMEQYVIAKGIEANNIVVESLSTTTRENLVNSRDMLERQNAPFQPVVVVTSDFHVLRTAALTRDLGLDAQVVGSTTARYYLPTAFLREFAAILKRYWKPNAAVFAILLGIVVFLQNVN